MIGSVDIIPASVLVIENHPLMREALCAAIADEPDLKVGLQAANGVEALQMFTIILPDIILLALGNPGTAELETLKNLRQALPEVPILALTSNEVVGQEQAALEAGAHVVLTKASSRSEIIDALHEMYKKNPIGHHQTILEQEANGYTSQ
jgi:DNA-binding NarL/FixJ family response regulator